MSALRVWLHEGHDAEPGCEAWALDVLGFASWARSHDLLATLDAYIGLAFQEAQERVRVVGAEDAADLHGAKLRADDSNVPLGVTIELLDGRAQRIVIEHHLAL